MMSSVEPHGIPRPGPDRSNTCGVVITYRPDDGLGERLNHLRAHSREIVVVDNGSGAEFTAILENARRSAEAMLISNPQNRGVAAALNQGVEVALSRGFEWALLLDQ